MKLGASLDNISEIIILLTGEIDEEPVNKILAGIKDANDNVMGIRVIDRNGAIIASSDTEVGTDLAARDYFIAGMNGEQFVSEGCKFFSRFYKKFFIYYLTR